MNMRLYLPFLVVTLLFPPLCQGNNLKNKPSDSLQSGLIQSIDDASATQVSIYLWKGASPNARINELKETPLMLAIHALAKEAKNNYTIEQRLKDIRTLSLCVAGGLTGSALGLLLILKSNLADRNMSSSEIILASSGSGIILLSLSVTAVAVAGAPFSDRATYSQTWMLYKRLKIIKKLLNHAEIDIHLTNENNKTALDIARSYITDNPDCGQLVKVMKKVESLLTRSLHPSVNSRTEDAPIN